MAERLRNIGRLVPDLTVGKVLRRLPFALDSGVYLQAEVALLTGLPKTTVRRWIQIERGAADIKAVAKQPLVSFFDLISLRAVAAFRKLGLRVSQVRKGADYMRDVLGIEYPLALEDLRTDGVNMYFVHGANLLAVDAGGQLAASDDLALIADTGAERTVISRAVAIRLGLDLLWPLRLQPLVGVGRSPPVPMVRLDRVRVGASM